MANKNVLIISAVVVIAALVAFFWYQANQQAPMPVEPVVQAPVYQPDPVPEPIDEPVAPITEPETPEISLVAPPQSIENSDSQVLLAVADFAPKLSRWLIPNEQIRKWVLTVDLMADGKLPKRYRPVDYPMEKFGITEQGDRKVVATDNFSRMNAIIETVIAIDPVILAAYYREWLPTLEKAYREQGKPDSFDQRFKQTISQVLAADTLEETPELVRPSVLYQFADPKLEQASDIDKLLWRMGPVNAEQLQSYLRELRAALESS